MQIPDPWKSLTVLWRLTVILLVVFAVFPGIDLWFSGLFYTGPQTFILYGVIVTDALRWLFWNLALAMAIVCVLGLCVTLLRTGTFLRVSRDIWLFASMLFVLGPGVVVNGFLKQHWGRARPMDVVEFGGAKSFTPPQEWANECASNCSFVSGEMAGATALAIVILIGLWHWRDRIKQNVFRGIVAFACFVPLFTAVQRVASGRHFLSDVTFALLFVLLIAAGLVLLLFPRAKTS